MHRRWRNHRSARRAMKLNSRRWWGQELPTWSRLIYPHRYSTGLNPGARRQPFLLDAWLPGQVVLNQPAAVSRLPVPERNQFPLQMPSQIDQEPQDLGCLDRPSVQLKAKLDEGHAGDHYQKLRPRRLRLFRPLKLWPPTPAKPCSHELACPRFATTVLWRQNRCPSKVARGMCLQDYDGSSRGTSACAWAIHIHRFYARLLRTAPSSSKERTLVLLALKLEHD